MSTTKKRGTTIAVAGAVAAVAIGGGVAWAAFTKDTSATASGKGGQLVAMTVVGTPQTVYKAGHTALWPGHPASISIEVQNDNEIPLQVTSVAKEAVGTTPSGCASHIEIADPVTVTQTGTPAANPTVPSGQKLTLTLPNAVTLKTTAPNDCQGATIVTRWKITGTAQ